MSTVRSASPPGWSTGGRVPGRPGHYLVHARVPLHRLSALMGDGTSNGSLSRERIALVHDFLLDLRGAERVFLAMCRIWPDADVFTAVYDEDGTEGRFAHRNVQATFLQ